MKKKQFYPNNKDFELTLKQRAKHLRASQTYCEKIIWNAIRNNQLGVKFRRQFIIAEFIVDFICIEKNLILEIDGSTHIGNEENDQIREIKLKSMGFRVLRFTDEEVTGNGNKVIERIVEYLNSQ